MADEVQAGGQTGAGTAVAPQSKTQRVVGKLPPELQAAVEYRRGVNVVAAQIAETNWGKGMDRETRRAVAEWGRRHAVDVTMEIYVLGGNIYLNARFYMNRLAAMVEAGVVEYAMADHVEKDVRLEALGDEGKAEIHRRLLERIKFQLPEAAVSAVVARVKLRNTPVEFSAAKWCGGRGKNKDGKWNDPIGENFPVETSETRAFRRCLRLLVSHIPEMVRRVQQAEEDAEVSLSQVLSEDSARQRIEEARAMQPPKMLKAETPGDPYGFSAAKAANPEAMAVVSEPDLNRLAAPAPPTMEQVQREGDSSTPDGADWQDDTDIPE
jgi:hypothetical protein